MEKHWRLAMKRMARLCLCIVLGNFRHWGQKPAEGSGGDLALGK